MTSVDYADYRSVLQGGAPMAGWRCGSAAVVPLEPWEGGGRWEEPEGRSRMGGSEEEPGGARRHERRTIGVGGG
jgi:hypothetical protein